MNEIDRSATRVSSTVALGAAFVAMATSALVTTTALATALPGVVAVFLGLARRSRRVVGAGVVGILLGVVIASVAGATALTVLVSVTAGVLVWDYASMAIGVGEQLGHEATTERLEAVHAVASLGVGVVTVLVSYGIYRSITGTHPVAALFFLLLATMFLARTLQ